jgi:low affinity Fe/Cu permease
MKKRKSSVNEAFADIAGKASQAAGSVWAFSGALLIVLVWAATGPIFHYSEVWQLVINTGTTIVTFLMVFVIQHAQNKDMRAVQLKLNELIGAVEGASNRLIDVEDLTDAEVEELYKRFQCLAKTAGKLSHGAKLTIDSSDDERDDGDERAPESSAKNREPQSEAEKKPVAIKPEARGRKH